MVHWFSVLLFSVFTNYHLLCSKLMGASRGSVWLSWQVPLTLYCR